MSRGLPRPQKIWYSKHSIQRMRVSKELAEVVFLGDSLVANLSRYSSVWDHHLAPLHPVNCGIGGDRSLNVLWRVERMYLPATCSTGIIHCGVNDIHASAHCSFKPQKIAENVISCGLKLRELNPWVSVIIMGILPAGQTAWGRNSRIKEVNAHLQQYCLNHGFLFIEQVSNWMDSSGEIDQSLFWRDHLHLNEKGCMKLAEIYADAIKRAPKVEAELKTNLKSQSEAVIPTTEYTKPILYPMIHPKLIFIKNKVDAGHLTSDRHLHEKKRKIKKRKKKREVNAGHSSSAKEQEKSKRKKKKTEVDAGHPSSAGHFIAMKDKMTKIKGAGHSFKKKKKGKNRKKKSKKKVDAGHHLSAGHFSLNLSIVIFLFTFYFLFSFVLVYFILNYYLLCLFLCGDLELNPGPTYSNAYILNWLKNNEKCNTRNLLERFKSENEVPQESTISCKAFSNKLGRLLKKEKLLRGEKKKTFLATEFKFNEKVPLPGTKELKMKNVVLKRQNVQLKQKVALFDLLKKNISETVKEKVIIYDIENEKLKFEKADLEVRLLNSENENTYLKRRIELLHTEKVKLEKKLNELKDVCSSQNLKNKALISDNVQYQEMFDGWQKKLDFLEKKFDKTNIVNKELRSEKKRLLRRFKDLKYKFSKVRVKDSTDYGLEIDSLTEKMGQLDKENQELNQLVSLLNDNDVTTFENGHYNDQIRKTVMKLVSLGVSIKRIDDVIKTVLGTLTSVDVSSLKLPSIGTKTNIVKEALCVAQFHIVEEMTNNQSLPVGNCLHGDGTTKYSKHYQNFQITTQSGKTLSFGLNEVADADSTSVLNSFISTIQDLVDVLNGDKEKDFAKLVCSITNTMSDMGPVNPLFNKKLQAFRENLLPTVVDKWDKLTKEEKDSFIEMGNFFCKLHLLANFASETNKLLKDFENVMVSNEHENKFAFKTKEAGPVQTVRIASKALHDRGSDECGVASEFNSFLQKKGKTKKIVSFVGNRFNILFFNAGAVYFHYDDIIHFISTTFASPNKLVLSLDELIKNKFNIACVRALGIAGKVVTSPFWRIIESTDNILSLNKYLNIMKLQLSKFSQDAKPVFMEEAVIWNETDELVKIQRDELYDSLFKETNDIELDCITIQALEQIFLAMLIILERQADDQLIGGKFSNPSTELLEKTSNVPAHNKASESDFGLLDLLMRLRPNANVETFQTLIMWSRNKTDKWLSEKSDSEQKELIEKAMKVSSKMSDKYKNRKEMLQKRKLEILEEKMFEKKRLEEQKTTKKTLACENIKKLNVSVWLSEEEVNEKLPFVDQKLLVLESQLNFYRDVLLCDRKLPRILFTKSEGGKKLGAEMMLQKLITVIRILSRKEDHPSGNNIVLKPHDEREEAYKEQMKKLSKRIYNDRLSNALKKRNQSDLMKIYNDPFCLINCTIQHRLKGNDVEFWVDGKVLGVVKVDTRNPHLSLYSVLFSGEIECTTIKLIKDMEKGNCFVQIPSWKG